MKPYDVPKLEWERMPSEMVCPHVATEPSPNIARGVREHIMEQKWLLKEGQELTLPPSVLEDHQDKPLFSISDFVVSIENACAEDVRASAFSGDRRKKLTLKQLFDIRRTGQFTVASASFVDQYHTWQVSRRFYAGTETNRRALLAGIGKALDNWVVFTVDSIFGAPETSHPVPNERIRSRTENEERPRRTVLDRFWPCHQGPRLVGAFRTGFLKPCKMLLLSISQWLLGPKKLKKYSKAALLRILKEAELGYIKTELTNHGMDPRRCSDDIYEASNVKLVEPIWDLLEEDAGWGRPFRRTELDANVEGQLRAQIMEWERSFSQQMHERRKQELSLNLERSKVSPVLALKEFWNANDEWDVKCRLEWLRVLRSKKIDANIGSIEADRLTALNIEQKMAQDDKIDLCGRRAVIQKNLQKEWPILSISDAWMSRRLAEYEQRERSHFENTRAERILQRLEEAEMHREILIRRSRRKFQCEIRPALEAKLDSLHLSYPPAEFEIPNLDPNYGRSHVELVDISRLGWRLHYAWLLFVQSFKYCARLSLHFLMNGPVSIRALVSRQPFYAIESPERVPSSYTLTFRSRLRSFYNSLNDVRDRFESTPDTGLIGKSVQRFFLRLYLGFKRITGTFTISVFMIGGCLFCTLFLLLNLVACPVFALIRTGSVALFQFLIYDTALGNACQRLDQNTKLGLGYSSSELPSATSPMIQILVKVPFLLLVPGAIQAVLALVRLTVIHPMVGFWHFFGSLMAWVIRSFRDSVTWLFISKHARVPASETPLASRIAGPGMASTHYYRLPLKGAKIAIDVVLDGLRFEMHSCLRRHELNMAYDQFIDFFRSLTSPFEVTVGSHIPRPSELADRWRVEAAKKRPELRSATFSLPNISKSRLNCLFDNVFSKIREAQVGFNELAGKALDAEHQRAFEKLKSLECLDLMAVQAIREQSTMAHEIGSCVDDCSGLRLTVARAGQLLAIWNLQVTNREYRMYRTIALPSMVRGKFRMSKDERDELWEYCLVSVQHFIEGIKDDIEELVASSNFRDALRPISETLYESIWTRAGLLPENDPSVVTAWILSDLLGGDFMLESLEEVDLTFVLTPVAVEDTHLIFW